MFPHVFVLGLVTLVIFALRMTQKFIWRDKKKKPLCRTIDRDVYDLRWGLVSKRIDPAAAKVLLNISSNSPAEIKFDSLIETQTKEVLHVYDRTEREHDYDMVVLRHTYRPWVAWYDVRPFSAPRNYNAAHENEFWASHDYLFRMILQKYRYYRALCTINENEHLKRWLNAFETRDGLPGIKRRLLEHNHTNHSRRDTSNGERSGDR